MAGWVIGSDGPSVTAVFSQAPGALQLLPTAKYAAQAVSLADSSRAWLTIRDPQERVLETLPRMGDPYEEIYLERQRWWGLVRPEWLRPAGGIPLSWSNYALNIAIAKTFHADLADSYHPNTYAFYGVDPGQNALGENTFQSITWKVSSGLKPSDAPGRAPPPPLGEIRFSDVRDDGVNPAYIGGQTEFLPSYGMGNGTRYETSHWELHCGMQDANGDGTVPEVSGQAPLVENPGCIKQQFRLGGFEHEAAYKNVNVQLVTLYSLMKIAFEAGT